jgi:DNA-3-methyladenine glycosylase
MDAGFFERDPVIAAEELIGCYLVRQTEQGVIRLRITETEAYRGADDPASHAFRKRTARNYPMFGDVGRLYIYFIYGMHYCVNIVCHEPGQAGAILLRGGVPLEGIELIRINRPGVRDGLLVNGPAKLAQALRLRMEMNEYDMINDPDRLLTLQLKDTAWPLTKTPRIGISAGADLPWRFMTV